MKKIYKQPKVEIAQLDYKYIMQHPSDGSLDENLSDQNKTFDEGELSTDDGKSGLWED